MAFSVTLAVATVYILAGRQLLAMFTGDAEVCESGRNI
jgi:Na+-driven multidrug efflux pump